MMTRQALRPFGHPAGKLHCVVVVASELGSLFGPFEVCFQLRGSLAGLPDLIFNRDQLRGGYFRGHRARRTEEHDRVANAMASKPRGRLDVFRKDSENPSFRALQAFRIEIRKRRNVGLIGVGHFSRGPRTCYRSPEASSCYTLTLEMSRTNPHTSHKPNSTLNKPASRRMPPFKAENRRAVTAKGNPIIALINSIPPIDPIPKIAM